MLGLDLVKVQLQLAGGATLAELGLAQEGVPQPRGYAIEARINMEAMELDGSVRPAGGLPTAFEPPSAAAHYELDDVIDPADSRRWIASGLRAAPPPEARTGKIRPCIDTW